jgi:hypothetical protein
MKIRLINLRKSTRSSYKKQQLNHHNWECENCGWIGCRCNFWPSPIMNNDPDTWYPDCKCNVDFKVRPD